MPLESLASLKSEIVHTSSQSHFSQHEHTHVADTPTYMQQTVIKPNLMINGSVSKVFYIQCYSQLFAFRLQEFEAELTEYSQKTQIH